MLKKEKQENTAPDAGWVAARALEQGDAVNEAQEVVA
jgi:hypothetical protein